MIDYNISNSLFDNDKGRLENGTLFRANMPGQFYVVTDYKLGRLVLEGSQHIIESEKPTTLRAFDLFDGIGSIFSTRTSDPHRRITRNFLAPSFSNNNY